MGGLVDLLDAAEARAIAAEAALVEWAGADARQAALVADLTRALAQTRAERDRRGKMSASYATAMWWAIVGWTEADEGCAALHTKLEDRDRELERWRRDQPIEGNFTADDRNRVVECLAQIANVLNTPMYSADAVGDPWLRATGDIMRAIVELQRNTADLRSTVAAMVAAQEALDDEHTSGVTTERTRQAREAAIRALHAVFAGQPAPSCGECARLIERLATIEDQLAITRNSREFNRCEVERLRAAVVDACNIAGRYISVAMSSAPVRTDIARLNELRAFAGVPATSEPKLPPIAALADARVAYHHEEDGNAMDLVEAIDVFLMASGVDILPRLKAEPALPTRDEQGRCEVSAWKQRGKSGFWSRDIGEDVLLEVGTSWHRPTITVRAMSRMTGQPGAVTDLAIDQHSAEWMALQMAGGIRAAIEPWATLGCNLAVAGALCEAFELGQEHEVSLQSREVPLWQPNTDGKAWRP